MPESVKRLHGEALCLFQKQCLPHGCRHTLQGKPLVERLMGIGHLLGIGDEQRPQQEQLIGARLQGEAREALIAAMAVRPSALDHSSWHTPIQGNPTIPWTSFRYGWQSPRIDKFLLC